MGTFTLFIRMLLALGLVLGLLFICSRVALRMQKGALRGPRRPRSLKPARSYVRARGSSRPAQTYDEIEIVQRRPLSRTSALALVRIGERELLIGTTQQQIQLLADLGDPGAAQRELDLDYSAFSAALDGGPLTASLLAGLPDDEDERSPRTAALDHQAPHAWDALVTTLRERTVRR